MPEDPKLVELLVRIDERVKAIDDKLEKQNGRVADHEQRIRWNERFRNFAMGALGLGAGGWGITEWWK